MFLVALSPGLEGQFLAVSVLLPLARLCGKG